MTVLTLRLSDQPVITLPAELARLAGLQEGGQVQVIPNQQCVTVLPATIPTDYTARWNSISTTLREQAAQFDLVLADQRDASYWETIAPLFAETERSIHSI